MACRSLFPRIRVLGKPRFSTNTSSDKSSLDTKAILKDQRIVVDDDSSRDRLKTYLEKEKVWEANVNLSQLTEQELEIYNVHKRACQEQNMFYEDPYTGLLVRTRLGHFMRNRCCGSGCRHCAYGHKNVKPEVMVNLRCNSAFYYKIDPPGDK